MLPPGGLRAPPALWAPLAGAPCAQTAPSPQVSGVPQSLVLVVSLSLSLVAPTPAAPGLVNTHCGCNGGFSAHRLLASAHPPTGAESRGLHPQGGWVGHYYYYYSLVGAFTWRLR